MKATQKLRDLGQSIWLDDVTRDLLSSGILQDYMAELSVTGLTFNATAFKEAIKNSSVYDSSIRHKLKKSKLGEDLFFDMAIEDLCQSADLLKPVYDRTEGMDGWAALDVSPLLMHDAGSILEAAIGIHTRAQRPNIFVKIPGTRAGLIATEEAIFAGVPVKVTLLFSAGQYLEAADAYMRGIERRIANGLKPVVGSVAAVSIHRWDAAASGNDPELSAQVLVSVARRIYAAYQRLLASKRWQRAYNCGAKPQRLLWASADSRVHKESDARYINALAAPLTINALPDAALQEFSDHGDVDAVMPWDGGDCEAILERAERAGIRIDASAARLQNDAVASLVKCWIDLMSAIAIKSAALVN
jgi:transaldolase